MSKQEFMLKIEDLVKKYHQQLAVDEVSFEVKPGRIFGLLGPNGAGKSSLLRMITGITLPDEGSVFIGGEAFNSKVHMSQIGYMPEERGLYKKMKVREHLVYLAQLKGLPMHDVNERIAYWFDRLGMESWTTKKVEDLSKGMSQKLQFVATVLHNPKILILDEPFSGLDPVNTKVIKDEIFELAQQGITIIFSTHRMEQVEEVCEDIVLMHNGKIILEGEVEDIKQKHKKNHFLVRTDASIKDLKLNFVSQQGNECIVALNHEDESQQLLNEILNANRRVLHFEEILPSLNDIFISLVENTAVRKFETA
jgi:ABC-2 type transport system ATP-binding protein